MRRKTNPFMQRKQEAAAPPEPIAESAPEPDPSTMSDEQLDKELARARDDLKRMKAAELERVREEVAEAAKTKSKPERTRFLPRRKRPLWK